MKKVPIIHFIGLVVPVLLLVSSAWADVAADLKQAEGLYKAGKYAYTEQVYRKILESSSDNPEAVYQAGRLLPRVYLATDRLPQAQEAVRQLLSNSAKHERLPHALHDIVDQAKLLKKTQQAGQIYQSLLTAQPNGPQAIWLKMGIAIANAHLGDDKAVDAVLQNIVAQHASDERAVEALGQTAWAYRKLEQPAKAGTVYQYVVANWPKADRAVFSQRGVILSSIALDDYATAEAGVQKLLADYADSQYMAEIVRSIAAEYYRKGNADQARMLHRYVMDNRPESLEALWSQRDLVFSYIDAANEQATEAALQNLVTSFAGHVRLPGVLAEIGEYYRKKGDLVNARQLHKQVVSRFPGSEQAIQSQRNAVLCSIGLNDEPQIETGIQILLTQFPEDNDTAAVIYYVADRLGESRDDEKLRLYQYIIDRHPSHVLVTRAKVKVGQIKIYQGDDTSAESIFEGVLADYRTHPELGELVRLMGEGYYIQALAEWRRGLRDKARSHFEEGLEKFELIIREQLPGTVHGTAFTHHFAGECCRRLGKAKEGIAYLQKVCNEWPDYRYAWHAQFSLGSCYLMLANRADMSELEASARMEQACSTIVEHYPDCPLTKYISPLLRGQNSQRNRLSKAIARLEPGLKENTLDPRWADPLYSLGHICERVGEIEGAAKAYRGFINTADAHDERLGNARAKLGQLGGSDK